MVDKQAKQRMEQPVEQPVEKREKATRRAHGGLITACVFLAVLLIGVGGNVALVANAQPSADAPKYENLPVFEVAEPKFVPPVKITISFAGDCTLGTDEYFDQSTSFNAYYDQYGPDYFFQEVKPIFAADDLTVVNCEGVLSNSTIRDDKEYAYKGRPEYAQIFARSSVEATATWNNHSYDYGWYSYDDTIEALEGAGLTVFGRGFVGYTEVKGIKIALVNGNMLGTGLSEENNVIPLIHEAQDAGAQLIIVDMHWGEMSEYNPLDEQIILARDCIDAGASVVVGSHQHVLQGVEEYNGRYIAYGLGNFCYGGARGLHDPDCYIFQQTFTFQDGVLQDNVEYNLIPCLIATDRSVNNYQPCVAEKDEAARIWSKVHQSSAYIANW